jgi:hypothetical protein
MSRPNARLRSGGTAGLAHIRVLSPTLAVGHDFLLSPLGTPSYNGSCEAGIGLLRGGRVSMCQEEADYAISSTP